MSLPRREFLKLGAMATTGVLTAGCASKFGAISRKHEPYDKSVQPAPKPISRLVNRLTFGANAYETGRATLLGREQYIEEQLAASHVEDEGLLAQLAALDINLLDRQELYDLRMEAVISQLQQQSILRAIYSKNQLQERMVDFWTNHFNIFTRIKDSAFRKPADDLEVIRKNSLGKFGDMVIASAHSPAMLAFLDNTKSRSGHPNENYARELMELHTLGLGGGYSQQDVIEVARCFTGWTIEDRFLKPRGHFRFDADRHDKGEKTVLGHKIAAGGGKSDGDRVLEILIHHPSTADFVAKKLCQFFLGEAGAELETVVARQYRETGGDIRAMLRPILLSKQLLFGPPLLKRPYDYVVSALRVLEANTDAGPNLQNHLNAMGQPLYQWPMPDGYPDRTSAWTGSMLARWNFALALSDDAIQGTSVDWKMIGLASQGRAVEVIPFVLGREGRGAADLCRGITDSVQPQELAILCLMSPEFQWR